MGKGKKMIKRRIKTIAILAVIFISLLGITHIFTGNDSKSAFAKGSDERKIHLVIDNGFHFEVYSQSQTVGEFFDEIGIEIGEEDYFFPEKETKIYSGSSVFFNKAKKVYLYDGGKEREIKTLSSSVENLFSEIEVGISEFDIVEPGRKDSIYDEMEVKITRVEVREEVEIEKIDYQKVTKEDDEMGWRESKVIQAGEAGKEETVYEVVYHNEKEISRKIKKRATIKDPVPQITKRGTYIEFGKNHKGLASWYAHTGTMSAANPWLPMGSYVKVTNRNNGKSVIVQINDRGPFGAGRIIDLDKVAFAEIAGLGEGVVDVKMEEILN